MIFHGSISVPYVPFKKYRNVPFRSEVHFSWRPYLGAHQGINILVVNTRVTSSELNNYCVRTVGICTGEYRYMNVNKVCEIIFLMFRIYIEYDTV